MKKILSSRVERYKNPQLFRTLNFNEFFNKRNKLLIIRAVGGLGDIFMHRMIFRDFKLICPDIEIHFACPTMYHDAVLDHPYIDKLLDSAKVDKSDYMVYYNTTTICGRTEMKIAPLSGPHRSDIWANHCGIELSEHNMYFNLTDEEIDWAKKKIRSIKNKTGSVVAFCPISAFVSKNLLPWQIQGVAEEINKKGCFVFGMHTVPIKALSDMNVPMISGINIRQMIALLNESDYVISVDTSAFHCAGGLGKKVVGIFTFADGLVYGKYYKNAKIVQKHRDLDVLWNCGPCYNWTECPKSKDNPKPCLTEITIDMIVKKFESFMELS